MTSIATQTEKNVIASLSMAHGTTQNLRNLLALWYNGSVRTAKTVGPMVRKCPFASLVPIIGGLMIGGHRTPFSRIRMRRIIGSEHPIQV
jgi:hypothetical protein